MQLVTFFETLQGHCCAVRVILVRFVLAPLELSTLVQLHWSLKVPLVALVLFTQEQDELLQLVKLVLFDPVG